MSLIEITWYSSNPIEYPYTQSTHLHDAIEFMYVSEGAVELTVKHQAFTVRKNDLIVIPAFIPHSIQSVKFPYERTCFRIFSSRSNLHFLPPELCTLLYSNNEVPIHIFPLEDHPETVSLVLRIHNEDHTAPYYEQLMQNLVYTLLISLFRINPTAFSVKDEQIEQYRLYFETNFKEKLSIEEIAEKFFISRFYFITKFKAYTGFSPNHYRNLCRIAHAKKLLIENNRPLSEIADECGFTDTNTFIRAFHREAQITPAKYREMYRSNPNFDT